MLEGIKRYISTLPERFRYITTSPEKFFVECGLIPSRKERVIRWLIPFLINIALLFFISKCYENKNYLLGIVLSVVFIGDGILFDALGKRWKKKW